MSVKQSLEPAEAELWVVDMQEKLMPLIEGSEGVTFSAALMIRAAIAIDVPIVLTEHNPKGLGGTIQPVLDVLPKNATRFEKRIFSCCGPTEVREHLAQRGRKQIIVAGIETHICVQQTVLELIRLGCQPFVLADAVGSRHALDCDVALLRMQQAGAVITTVESAVYELMYDADHAAFKPVLELIKEADRFHEDWD